LSNNADSLQFPYVQIRLRIAGQQAEIEIEENAFLDTGFDGQVILPLSMLAQLGAPELTRHWTLADGSPAISYSYSGVIELAELPNQTRVTVDVIGSEVMIGRRLIEPLRVILDHGREVIVEP
jgi:predicted aspartyl protease